MSAFGTTISPLSIAFESVEISVVTNDERSAMSSAEAQHHHLATMAAAAFAAEQFWALQNARVEDLEKLLMVEADGSFLDELSQTVFIKVFGGGKTADGKHLPIQRARLEDAMGYSVDEG